MERGLEVEDDLFYADLTKRISLLIMDDDEDLKLRYPPPLSLEGHHRIVGQPFAASHPLLHRREVPGGVAAPAYMRETKGTGVFIPRSSQPRRKNRSGRSRQQGRVSKQEEQQ